MNKLILFSLVVLSLFALSAGQDEEETVNLQVEEDAERMELAEPEAKRQGRKSCKAACKKSKNRKQCLKKCNGKHSKRKGQKKAKKPKKPKKPKKKKPVRPAKDKVTPHGRQAACKHSDTCIANVYTIMDTINKKISFWKKQKSRAETHATKAGKKQDKMSDFATGLNNLVTAGGGSKTSPACNGNTTSDGAMALKSLIANMTKCEQNIKDACGNDTVAAPTDAEVTACSTAMDEYKTMADACGAKTGDEACTCWDDTTFTTKREVIINCTNNAMSNGMTMKDYQKAVTAAKKNCTDAFGQCRKDEDAAGAAISTCSTSETKLTESLNSIASTSAAATSVKTKITALTSRRRRSAGYPAYDPAYATPTTCAEFLAGVKALFASMADNLFGDYTSTAAELTAFSGSCSDEEKTALATESANADAIVTEATALTTQIQSQISDLTGSTASSAQIEAASTTAASSATESGRKRRLAIEKLLRRANFK